MRPTTDQLAGAVSEFGAIPYFPNDSGAQLAIMRQLEKFVSGAAELRWLVDTAISVMRDWKGVPELRGLYCTRFRPADGREANCSLPGYTPEESEARYALAEARRPRLAEPSEVAALARRKAIGAGQCLECGDEGIRQAEDDCQLHEWCVCPSGQRRRAEAPGAVDQANATVLKLRQRFEPSTGQAQVARNG